MDNSSDDDFEKLSYSARVSRHGNNRRTLSRDKEEEELKKALENSKLDTTGFQGLSEMEQLEQVLQYSKYEYGVTAREISEDEEDRCESGCDPKPATFCTVTNTPVSPGYVSASDGSPSLFSDHTFTLTPSTTQSQPKILLPVESPTFSADPAKTTWITYKEGEILGSKKRAVCEGERCNWFCNYYPSGFPEETRRFLAELRRQRRFDVDVADFDVGVGDFNRSSPPADEASVSSILAPEMDKTLTFTSDNDLGAYEPLKPVPIGNMSSTRQSFGGDGHGSLEPMVGGYGGRGSPLVPLSSLRGHDVGGARGRGRAAGNGVGVGDKMVGVGAPRKTRQLYRPLTDSDDDDVIAEDEFGFRGVTKSRSAVGATGKRGGRLSKTRQTKECSKETAYTGDDYFSFDG